MPDLFSFSRKEKNNNNSCSFDNFFADEIQVNRSKPNVMNQQEEKFQVALIVYSVYKKYV